VTLLVEVGVEVEVGSLWLLGPERSPCSGGALKATKMRASISSCPSREELLLRPIPKKTKTKKKMKRKRQEREWKWQLMGLGFVKKRSTKKKMMMMTKKMKKKKKRKFVDGGQEEGRKGRGEECHRQHICRGQRVRWPLRLQRGLEGR
jgi:hypothetical protein